MIEGVCVLWCGVLVVCRVVSSRMSDELYTECFIVRIVECSVMWRCGDVCIYMDCGNNLMLRGESKYILWTLFWVNFTACGYQVCGDVSEYEEEYAIPNESIQ